MAGRKPKPTKLKIIQGTAQKCRMNKNEPAPESCAPEMPPHLSKLAAEEWRRITPELIKLGLLSEIDMSALAAYCQTYGRWVEAEDMLKKSSQIIKTMSGNVIQNPLVGIANKSLYLMHKFLTEFGMTPSSRTRVSGSGGQETTNPFTMLKNG